MKNIFNSFFFKIIFIFIGIEFLSLITFFDNFWGLIVFVLIIYWIIILTIADVRYGLYIMLAELIVGGKGYLFFYDYQGFSISIRLAMFVAIFLAWLLVMIFSRKYKWLKENYLILTMFLGLLVLLSFLRGLSVGTDWQIVFADANAYLYFALIGAFLFAKLKTKKVIQVILAGSTLVAIKTITVLILFSHKLAVLQDPFYIWIRNTGIGEITPITNSLFRVFFQSHFYSLIALILILAVLFLRNRLSKIDYLGLGLLAYLNILVLLISQSKSFWIAIVFAIVLLFISMIIFRIKWQRLLIFLILIPLLVIASHLTINFIINDFSINLFFSRLDGVANQAGVSSRSAQIAPAITEIKKAPIMGNGFGKQITYQSSDPRIKTESNPEGWYTTDALELGYLDMTIDIGILGILVYMILILYLLIKTFKFSLNHKYRIGFLLGIIVLVVIHAFTPYLNHPLGIGYILLMINLTK